MVGTRKHWMLVLALVASAGLLFGLPVGRGLLAQNGAKPGEKTTDKSAAAEKAGAKPGEKDARSADRAAIRKMMLGFAEAFKAGDAPAAAAFMTSGAEMVTNEGVTIRGREAIQEAYAAHFARHARPKINLEVASLEFPSRDTAIEEGLMTIVTGAAEAPVAAGGAAAAITAAAAVESTTNHYNILYVREDGKWLLASIRESAAETSPLQELGWLIGSWSAKGKESEAHTTYEWFGNKAFIKAQFSIREKETTVAGMQLIGIDPETNLLRTWTFEADGGLGQGTVTRDGNKWVFETTTTLNDARIMTSSNVLVPVNGQTFTWQPVELIVDGVQIANLPPVKVTRVDEKK